MREISFGEVELALRVLTALMERAGPAPDDIQRLFQSFPNLSYLPLDELACTVVERHMAQRRLGRGSRIDAARTADPGA